MGYFVNSRCGLRGRREGLWCWGGGEGEGEGVEEALWPMAYMIQMLKRFHSFRTHTKTQPHICIVLLGAQVHQFISV
jgi:hypothetical protein